jgi:ubiquinone/menaquinone biosynthesis C-methylase UbiE
MPEGPASSGFYERYWFVRTSGKLDDFGRKWPVLRSFIPRGPKAVVLDYGCGDGEIIKELAAINPGACYIGADVSDTALARARTSLPDVSFHRIEREQQVPVPSASIDFIFCSEVIEHIYDTEAAFAEFARLLRPGGRVLITTPYHGLVKNLLLVSLAFDRHFDPKGPHVRFFSKRALFRCLRQAGLQPERHGYIGRFYPIPMAIYVLARKGESGGIGPRDP